MGWTTSKKFRGVRIWTAADGEKIYYIQYRSGKRLVTEKIGSEKDKITATLSSTIRASRINDARLGNLAPVARSDIPALAEVAAAYMAWADKNKKSARDDRARWRDYLEKRVGHLRPDQVTPRDVEIIRDDLAGTKAPATVVQILGLLRSIYNRGRAWGLIHSENPVSGIEMPKIDNNRERMLTQDECEKLLAELKKRSLATWAITVVALNTGARRGELFSLEWRDVDLISSVATFRETKNGRTRRVPLNRQAKQAIETMERRSGLVFPLLDGREQTHNLPTFVRVANDLFNPEGTPKRYRVTFHTLRHTAASRLVAAGIPLNVVQEILGHRSLKMLERYSHLLPNATRAAVEVLGWAG